MEIESLLPASHHAVVKSAPGGMVFADRIRTSGLNLLTDLDINEDLPLTIELVELDRWGRAIASSSAFPRSRSTVQPQRI